MSLTDIPSVLYLLEYIIPGYIITAIIDKLNPREVLSEYVFFVRCLLYGFIFYVFFDPLKQCLSCCSCQCFRFLILAIECLIACISGLTLGLIKQKNCISRFLGHFNVKSMHSTPTAWDYVFYNKDDVSNIIIHMRTGEVIKGKYDWKSFTSSILGEHDIYIEHIYQYINGEWKRSNTLGVYVHKNEIAYIELEKKDE